MKLGVADLDLHMMYYCTKYVYVLFVNISPFTLFLDMK